MMQENNSTDSECLAIAFGKWLFTRECIDLIHDLKIVGEDTSIEALFEEFKKNNND